MSRASADYVFGGNQTELDRLILQAEDLGPETAWMLDTIGIQPGWAAADIGCGPIGAMNLLSERVGPQGKVVGIEREAKFAAMARHEIARRGLGNVSVVEGDAIASDLRPSSFDLVHERLVLINMPPTDQLGLLAQMIRLAKPGGIIAVASWDKVSHFVHPPHPSWDALDRAYRTSVQATNGDGTVGRSLPGLLRQVGLTDVRAKVHCRAVDVSEQRRTHRLRILDVAKPKILAGGYLTEDAFEAHLRALEAHLADPNVLLVDQLFVQAWGRRAV